MQYVYIYLVQGFVHSLIERHSTTIEREHILLLRRGRTALWYSSRHRPAFLSTYANYYCTARRRVFRKSRYLETFGERRRPSHPTKRRKCDVPATCRFFATVRVIGWYLAGTSSTRIERVCMDFNLRSIVGLRCAHRLHACMHINVCLSVSLSLCG